jgi:ABC-type sugar transport system ATPase subunit
MKVAKVENRGGFQLATMEFGGAQVVAKLDSEISINAGESHKFDFNLSRTFLFDGEGHRVASLAESGTKGAR